MSELTLGGIVRHVATGERVWARIMVTGDGALLGAGAPPPSDDVRVRR